MVIKNIFYRGGTNVNIHMRYKQYYILCPFLRGLSICVSSNLLITNPPIRIFLNPWISSHTISLSLWIGIDPRFWPSLLPPKVENRSYHSNFCPLKDFLLLVRQVHIPCGATLLQQVMCATQTRTTLFLPQLTSYRTLPEDRGGR